MVDIKTFEKLLKNHKLPYFIVEIGTKTVSYLNEEMKKLFLGRSDPLGEVFSDLIEDTENTSYQQITNEWKANSATEATIFDHSLQRQFHVTCHCVNDDGCKCFLLEYAYADESGDELLLFRLADNILARNTDDESKINGLLHLLGESYLGHCAYVHLVNHQNKTIKLKNSWVKSIISETSDYLVEGIEDVAGFDGLILWAKGRNPQGIWDCDLNRTDSTYKAMDRLALSLFKRKNLLLCGVDDPEGNLIMTVCVGDCESLAVSHDLLLYITKVVASLINGSVQPLDSEGN